MPAADPMVPRRRACAAAGARLARRLDARARAGRRRRSPSRPGQFNMLYRVRRRRGRRSRSAAIRPSRAGSSTPSAPSARSRARLRALRAGRRRRRARAVRRRLADGEAAGRDVVVVAGGLGLAPLRPALYRVLADARALRQASRCLRHAQPGRHPLPPRARSAGGGGSTSTSRSRSTTPTPDWRGHVGVVTTLIPRAAFDPRRHDRAGLRAGDHDALRDRRAARRAASPTTRIYLSMERNMKCAIGFCGHCQFGPIFVCKDGPVFRYDRVARAARLREI